MATNKSMIEILERGIELIDELSAIRKVLRHHIAAQKRQGGKDWNDTYAYDAKRKQYRREPTKGRKHDVARVRRSA